MWKCTLWIQIHLFVKQYHTAEVAKGNRLIIDCTLKAHHCNSRHFNDILTQIPGIAHAEVRCAFLNEGYRQS